MQNLRTILHLNSYFAGTDLHRLQVEAIARTQDFKQIVLVPNDLGVHKELSNDKNARIEIIQKELFNSFDNTIFITKVMKYWSLVKKQVDLESIDLVHAHTLFVNGYVAYRLKKTYSIPYVITVRSADIYSILRKFPFLIHVAKNIMREAEKVIFLGKALWYDTLAKFLDSESFQEISTKTEFIPNGIDTYWIDNKADSITHNYDSLKVVCVAELIPRKNVDLILKALEELSNEGHKVSFNWIGKGEIKTYGLQRYSYPIHYHGFISDKSKIKEVFSSANVFALISKVETFGLVYPEAMSQGLPILYTKSQGFDYWFADGDVGYAVENDSLSDLKEKLLMIKKHGNEMGNRAIKASEQFRWDTIAEKLRLIYKEV